MSNGPLSPKLIPFFQVTLYLKAARRLLLVLKFPLSMPMLVKGLKDNPFGTVNLSPTIGL